MVRVVASGAFDPIHRGHIAYLKEARKLGDYLVVVMRNDKGILAKKDRIFMPLKDRKAILESLYFVNEVFISIDDDGSSVESLKIIQPDIYAKGGDALDSPNAAREAEVCRGIGCKIVSGIVPKIQSSSEILRRYKEG